MKTMMKHSTVGLLVVLLAGCSVTSRLERRQSRALADYAPREQAAPKPAQTRNYMTVKHDSTTYYIAEAATDENGETVANFRLDEVVVVAKSRTLSERKGKVLVDFVVTLPKELQGGCRNVVVVPHLHKAEGEVPLQELSIRGGLFSRVQDRNYWQYAQYVRLFRPDAAGEQRAFERFVKHPYPQGVRLDSIVEGTRDISYYYSQEVPTRSEGKTMLLTLHGAVVALDGSRYDLPPLDTLRYHISSMLSFTDTTTRYVTEAVEKGREADGIYIVDTLYTRGVKLLNERKYNDALRILRPYEDRNTAVALLSLGYDEQAYEVLCRLKEEATVEYLKAVACARLGHMEEGKEAFRRACELQPNFEYRGNLDPEIRELITTE